MTEDTKNGLNWLLLHIGSWTNSRWDQWLRYEFGDERSDKIIKEIVSIIGENSSCVQKFK